jgi:5,6-dimethylbenzimidazole synthase
VSILDRDALRRILGIPEPVLPVAYLCLGWVEGYHRQPELERAGWRQRLPIGQVVHFDRWGGGEGPAGLLERLREDAQAVADGRFLAERLES